MKIFRGAVIDMEGDARFVAYKTSFAGAFQAIKTFFLTDNDYKEIVHDIGVIKVEEFELNPDTSESTVVGYPYSDWTLAIEEIEVTD